MLNLKCNPLSSTASHRTIMLSVASRRPTSTGPELHTKYNQENIATEEFITRAGIQ